MTTPPKKATLQTSKDFFDWCICLIYSGGDLIFKQAYGNNFSYWLMSAFIDILKHLEWFEWIFSEDVKLCNILIKGNYLDEGRHLCFRDKMLNLECLKLWCSSSWIFNVWLLMDYFEILLMRIISWEEFILIVSWEFCLRTSKCLSVGVFDKP